ncbi:MAG: Na+/H+ antiporter NhaA, partial [Candidatus Heimdallarchaeota archaeon]|nr:Na+/H+ antiporter NhaA [Candidatus Heimdallarchaeota archaeon]
MNESNRYFPKVTSRSMRTIRPFKKFIESEAASGVILIVSVIIALTWANIDPKGYYNTFHIYIGIIIGEFKFSKSLAHWINDLLMSIFFLLIGLEIKREILIGELSNIRKALLPFFGAIGGMLVPALLFFSVNSSNPERIHGWAIPMATDIAFALGIIFLLGNRVPTILRIFLATLAIIDDLGAVIIIAVFYTSSINMVYLGFTAICTLILIGFNYIGIRKAKIYVFIGMFLWYFMYMSGIHATLSGIILAMTIPATTKINFDEFKSISNGLISRLNEHVKDTEVL